MAGGYTHLTLVREALTACRREGGLEDAISQWGAFAYLGGVSPDYPYLLPGAANVEWADRMHKGGTHLMIGAAMRHLFDIRHSVNQDAWGKKLAWLLGFVSHILADVTIHPVVNLRVGKYETHKAEHRDCEMNQDVHIYAARVGLDLHKANNMTTMLRRCGNFADFSDVVEEIWRIGFKAAYGDQPDDKQIDSWNVAFMTLIRVSEKGGDIPILSRVLLGRKLAYPQGGDLDLSFLKDLRAPSGKAVDQDEQPVQHDDRRDFDAVFTKALSHITAAWLAIRDDLFDSKESGFVKAETLGTRHLRLIGNWSLDTGIDNDDPDRKLRLWPYDERL